MNILLDTHVFIWTIIDDDKLSARVKESIEDNDNRIFISSVTYWEIAVKFSIGKLSFRDFTPRELPQLAASMGFESIALLPNETATSYLLEPVFHKDPFDRMLIWQAIANDFVLATKDEYVRQYTLSGLKVLW